VPGSASIMQTCDMALPDDIDPRLWVKIKGVDGRCYLFGNNHTFKGRMCAYSEALETDLGVSRGEITASADEAQYWIEGFLAGNEPSEAEALGDDDDDNPEVRFRRWQEMCADFRRSGIWRNSTKDM
jgi:hypothetical protein